jgi:hypothetical protein
MENVPLDLVDGKSAQVGNAEERRETADVAGSVGNVARSLRELDIILATKKWGGPGADSRSRKVSIVQFQLNADELDTCCLTVGYRTVLNRLEDRSIRGRGRVVDRSSRGDMPQEDVRKLKSAQWRLTRRSQSARMDSAVVIKSSLSARARMRARWSRSACASAAMIC